MDETLKPSQAAQFLLDECRMVLPGIQALFGFQLVAVFNDPFKRDLAAMEQALHFAAICLVAIAIALIMTPAAYHRQTGVTTVTERFLRNCSRLLLAAMVPLGLAIGIDFYVVGVAVFGSRWPAVGAAALVALFFFAWFVFPRSKRLQELLDS